MIMNRFLSLFIVAFLCNVTAYSQFDLVKDFDGGTQNSFGASENGILYSIGTKMLVQYDSFSVDGQLTSMESLTAVDAAGNSQRLASSTFNMVDQAPFSDFKTLPNGKVAFIVVESNTSFKILITDGTAAGTTAAYSSTTAINGLELIDNGLYFTHEDNAGHALMKIELATLAVSEIASFGTVHAISDITKISATALIFLATDARDDDILKLYVSDGTSAGTTALTVINDGDVTTEKALLTQVGNKVYFFSKLPDVACCSALWVTDGTVSGTQKLKEFSVLSAEHLMNQEMIFGWNNAFYFAAAELGTTNTEPTLWVSDGTVAGTRLLMPPSAETIHPRRFTVFKNALYFIVASGINYNNELYKTDGTVAGTVHIDLKYNSYYVGPYSMAADEDYLYMAGGNPNSSFHSELFRYDGIDTQCAMLEGEIGSIGGSQPNDLYIHGGELYFTARLAATAQELYTTGGDFIQGVATATRSAAAQNSVVYPNPAKDVVTVTSSEKITSLRVINQVGAVVAETTEATLDVSSYSAGIYYVEIFFPNNESAYQKLVVNK